jgi:hypothetical protein
MYFMPLILLVAAGALGKMKPLARGLLAASQVLWVLVLAAAIRTVVTGDVRPPPTFAEVAPPALAEPYEALQADFGNQLRLLGYQSRYQPKTHSLKLALHWEGLQQMRAPYYFSGVAVAPDGAVLPASQTQPFATRYPTTCWPRGQEIVDYLELPLGQDLPQGNWWVSLSVFELKGNQSPIFLPVRLPDGRTDQQVGLGPLKVNMDK